MRILHSAPFLTEDEIRAVRETLESRHLEDGEVVDLFENAVKSYVGRTYAAATINGFAAIHLCLLAMDVGSGDEVIIPSFSCPALLNPVLIQRAKPVIVDIEEGGFNISPDAVRRSISSKTKAIIVPHMFGFPARIDEIASLGIPVIEDCAQSIGGSYKGRKLGAFTVASVFSFYASKVITSGDGGMVVTDDEGFIQKVRDFRYYGHKRAHKVVAWNYHLTNLPASLGAAQMKRLDVLVGKRRELAAIYDEELRDIPGVGIGFVNRADAIYFRYPVEVERREAVKERLSEKGIDCGYGVLEGLHELAKLDAKGFPNTDRFLSRILSLPLYPSLTAETVEAIAKEVAEAVRS